MIKAILTDIDGVMVGKQHGVNFPLPCDLVIQKLKEIHNNGMPVILCTAKFHSGIYELVKKADLRNPQITDGGALIIDPLDNKIIKKHTFDQELFKKIVSTCIQNEIYTECYGTGSEDFFVQKDQVFDLTEKHTLVMQQKQQVVLSLEKNLANKEIIKIEAFAKDKEDMNRVDALVKQFANNVNILWTGHPTILPFQICVITLKGVSKKAASIEVLNYLEVSPDNTLAIGDTLGDWDFMEICKYAATVGDESKELKDLVKTKGDDNYFYGSSVDDNGLLEVFNHFLI